MEQPPIHPNVRDVTSATFERDVLDESRKRPVVVDFWAAWCGPCRALGPLLEKLAGQYTGKFLLAKVDVDAEPRLASQYRVEGIPLVVAFLDGKIAGEFVGVQPESAIREFLDRLCPGPAETLAREAAGLEASDPEKSWRLYEEALAADPKHARTLAALADLALAGGDAVRAREYASRVMEGSEGWPRAANVLAKLEFHEAASRLGTIEECRARATQNPADGQTQLNLGLVLAAHGQFEEALETLVKIVENNRAFGAEHAKAPIVRIFGILGQQSELVNRYRPRLAAALY